jgi:glycosyltransferase involved in cell wall biosynthesis
MRYSVVVPVYNGERFIREALDSVLNQTHKVDEIVVYDDCSTDSSVSVVSSYGSSVRLVRGAGGPSGFVNGWNKAIACALSEYVSILHQDDVLYPRYFEEVEAVLQRYPDIRHVFSVCDYIDEQSIITDRFPEMPERIVRYSFNEYVAAYQREYGVFPHIHRCPGVVTHRSIFEKDGCCYQAEAGHIADDDFFYRVGQYTDAAGILVSCAAYRQHRYSATGVLEDLQMTTRLFRDYSYQVRQWSTSQSLGKAEKYYFEYWALRYAFRSLAGALKQQDKELFNDIALSFRDLKGLLSRQSGTGFKISALECSTRLLGFERMAELLRKHA